MWRLEVFGGKKHGNFIGNYYTLQEAFDYLDKMGITSFSATYTK